MVGETSTLFLGAPALIVVGLLTHLAGRLCEHGLAELCRSYAPVFPLMLPRWANSLCQTIMLPAALVVEGTVPGLTGQLIGIGLVVLWVGSIQRRLANHVWLAMLALVGFACTPSELDWVVARDLLAGVYLSAAFFKVNKDYLTGEQSPGRVIAEHYARGLGLPVPGALLRWVPAAVVVVELVVGVLLLVPGGGEWGLLLALLMHWVFGLTGNFPFSIIAMTLWVTMFSAQADHVVLPAQTGLLWLMGALSCGFAVLFRWKSGKIRKSRFFFRDVVESALFGVLAAIVLSLSAEEPAALVAGAAPVHWAIAAVFVINALLLVAGVKLEWSFAMFTGLRPFGRSWLQRGGLRDWPRYYSLTLPARIPEPLLKMIGPEFLYRATRADAVVHESVVRHLETAAARWRTTFVPRAVVNNRDTGDMEPIEDRSQPRRIPLFFPAVIPKNIDKLYLG
ncbi:hypothetical protein [Amycolatopsis keratiniphila]|uniref:HTTM domain-containing protein n=1 Tax=Amycolatopsis keratiniphila subsp. keratiniphila TaxID=227715 RepID=A0A1W2LTD1_9PSEU|nr:hypothetical protein [Amycolatopsis keratiniphila]ONF67869.1 hypothetical protein AVR91_0220700 [Amycolatopsis keratiniphila subsp. keratiniphila]